MQKLTYLFHQDEHLSCVNYKTSLDYGFKYVELKAGEKLKSKIMPRHNLVMLMSGESTITCDQFPERTLQANEMILIPRSAFFEARIVKDAKLILFGFEVPQSNCDKHRLESYSPLCEQMEYDFRPTPIRKAIELFLTLTAHYLESGINCVHMHESKHRELFMCLKAFYSKEEVAYLLHPIIGRSIEFKNIILQNCDEITSTNDMISLTNMSRTLFYKSFKEAFGTTAKQWLIKRNVEKMYYHASRPNISAKELMNEMGFELPAQFSQFCKTHCNMTPTQLIISSTPEKR